MLLTNRNGGTLPTQSQELHSPAAVTVFPGPLRDITTARRLHAAGRSWLLFRRTALQLTAPPGPEQRPFGVARAAARYSSRN